MPSEHSKFLDASKKVAPDRQHREKIGKAISTYDAAVFSMKSQQFLDWDQARSDAAQVKDYALANLAELLISFESKIKRHGTEVLWAENALQSQQLILEIVRQENARTVVKSKSMTTEEIGLNELLEASGVKVYESDLGELIVQLAGEKPYHIVTPAMHKTKRDISELFHRCLGIPETDSPEELTMAARSYLRDKFTTADIGVTSANFLIADSGAIVVTENEGNAMLTMAAPKTHIVVCGIEKILPRLSDLSMFLPLLATSGTGQRITTYNSIVYGPKCKKAPDGPDRMVVILLDNGRSELYAREDIRTALRCIRCGACLNKCPVYKTVGGHAYNSVYQGPIGSVITPHFGGMANWHHLSYASSLCGACSTVCPVNIDIHKLLHNNRKIAVKEKKTDRRWLLAMIVWSFLFTKPQRIKRLKCFLKFGQHLLFTLLPKEKAEKFPKMAARSFSDQWSDHVSQR